MNENETLDPETVETPAPETPAQPDQTADFQRQIAELREQIAESNRTAQFWAEQARGSAQNGHATPAQPGEPDEEPEDDDTDVLEAITTKGTKGFDALAAKRGFIKRSEVENMIDTRTQAVQASYSKEQELLGRYPDLKDRGSDFFRATAGHYGQLVKSGVNAQTAMELASEKAELDFMRAGKLPTPDSNKGTRASDRQARIDAQGGGGSGRRPSGADTDDDVLTPEQKHIARAMGISEESYLKRAKSGVNMGGRARG